MAANTQPAPEPAMTGPELRHLRERTGLTQTAFAPRIGTTGRNLSLLELGKTPISPEMATTAKAAAEDHAIFEIPTRRGYRRSNQQVEDGPFVEAALSGKTKEAIAKQLGVTIGAVFKRLTKLGFPVGAAGRKFKPYRFWHGEPLVKRHFDDLCRDFCVDIQTVTEAGFAEGLIRTQPCPWFQKSGKAKDQKSANYSIVQKKLGRFHANGPLDLRLADATLGLRQSWTEKFCFCIEGTSGKPVRHFVQSEIRDIPTKWQELYEGMESLRTWLRVNCEATDAEILDWICFQCRGEVVRQSGACRTFRVLMFRWLSLKGFIQNHRDALIATVWLGELVDKFLGEEYGIGERLIRKIRESAKRMTTNGRTEALQPRLLGMRVREYYALQAGRPRQNRGRQRGAISPATLAAITLAAHYEPRMSKYEAGPYVYGGTNDDEIQNARKSLYDLYTRHGLKIEAERQVLASLPEGERSARVQHARAARDQAFARKQANAH